MLQFFHQLSNILLNAYCYGMEIVDPGVKAGLNLNLSTILRGLKKG